jgi:hypothetical protein
MLSARVHGNEMIEQLKRKKARYGNAGQHSVRLVTSEFQTVYGRNVNAYQASGTIHKMKDKMGQLQ